MFKWLRKLFGENDGDELNELNAATRRAEALANLPPLAEEEIRLIRSKDIIQAIKLYKDRTGADLKTAKAKIDSYIE